MAGERVYSDEDDDKEPNGKDNITQTAYWYMNNKYKSVTVFKR